MKIKSAIAAMIPFAVSTTSLAAGMADQISAADPYVRLAAPGAKVTGAFMVLKNSGSQQVSVVSASSLVAANTELHNHINDNGVMRMRQVKEILIPAKGEVALKPGSYHVMLIDMKAPLREDDHVVIKLGLADGSSKEVHALVKKPTGDMPMQGMDHGKHNH